MSVAFLHFQLQNRAQRKAINTVPTRVRVQICDVNTNHPLISFKKQRSVKSLQKRSVGWLRLTSQILNRCTGNGCVHRSSRCMVLIESGEKWRNPPGGGGGGSITRARVCAALETPFFISPKDRLSASLALLILLLCYPLPRYWFYLASPDVPLLHTETSGLSQ